jgi:hypothetical protein
MDFFKLLNRKAGKFTLLSIYDPVANKRWDETVKPINRGEEGELLYKRWVRARRAETERLSGGRIGYIHVRAMNDPSMRAAIDESLGSEHRQGRDHRRHSLQRRRQHSRTVVDFLSGKKYFDVVPHWAVHRKRTVRQVDQAIDRTRRREQLLRRASLPARVQG